LKNQTLFKYFFDSKNNLDATKWFFISENSYNLFICKELSEWLESGVYKNVAPFLGNLLTIS